MISDRRRERKRRDDLAIWKREKQEFQRRGSRNIPDFERGGLEREVSPRPKKEGLP